MSVAAHEFLDKNLDRLNYHVGVTKMSIERPPERGDKRDSHGQVVGQVVNVTGSNQDRVRERTGEQNGAGLNGARAEQDHAMNGQEERRDYEDLMEQDTNENIEGRVNVPPNMNVNTATE